MDPLLAIGIYLVVAWTGVVIAKVFMYYRPRLSENLSCFFNWLILFVMLLGIPWLLLFKLLKQENWVNQLLFYFQLRRLTIYTPQAVQELFKTWQEHHALAAREAQTTSRDGFHRVTNEQVHWLSTRQVLLEYVAAKPFSFTDTRTGIEYLQIPHPDSSGYYFSGKICLVRTNQDEFGIYSESYAMY